MKKPELVRPKWRDGRAYAQALSTPVVCDKIKETLAALPQACVLAQPTVDVEEHFPALVKDLRLHDLGDPRYWLVMMVLCTAFIGVELWVVIQNIDKTPELLRFEQIIAIGLIILVGFLIMYIWALIDLMPPPSWASRFSNLWPGSLHALPVIWASLFSVGLNFWVVSQTGFGQSPFLHALLASVLVVLSLPRENSLPVVALAVVTGLLGVAGTLGSAPTSVEELSAWGGDKLADSIVSVTFIYSVVSMLILRSLANHRIERSQ